MNIYEKIRRMRQLQGFSQEDMAEKLEMSVNGYASIEQGKSDIHVSRLEQIAKTFEVDLLGLIAFGEKGVFYVSNNHNNYNSFLNTKDSDSKELETFDILFNLKNEETHHLKEEINYLRNLVLNLSKKDQ